MRIIVSEDPAGLADRAASHIAGLVSAYEGRRVSLGLAGGSTPRATYERLRNTEIDWPAVDVWLSDERWVPRDDPDSNSRMARLALLDHVPALFHDIGWSKKRLPQAAAQEYAAKLETIFTEAPDIVLLGMGEDGHTASLFPGTDALENTSSGYLANFVPGKGWRLTATLGLLSRARHLVFLVAGAGKAGVLSRVLTGEPLPSTLVVRNHSDVTWLVDEAAAAKLNPS